MVYTTAGSLTAACRSRHKQLVVFYQPQGHSGPAVSHQDSAGQPQAEWSRIVNMVVSN